MYSEMQYNDVATTCGVLFSKGDTGQKPSPFFVFILNGETCGFNQQIYISWHESRYQQPSHEKRAPSCLGYIGDYTTQLSIIRIPIKQRV